MTFLTVLMLQAGGLWAPGDDDPLPRISDLEWEQKEARAQYEEFIGLEPFFVWTRFDQGLRIDDHFGWGADVLLGREYHEKTRLAVSVGYAGWNTRNDEGQTGVPASVWVRQYRLGFRADWSFRFLELGIGATVGLYRFRREHENDTAPYFEGQALLAVRPFEMLNLKVGVLGMSTWTHSNFNRGSTHWFHNYGVGPAVEIRY